MALSVPSVTVIDTWVVFSQASNHCSNQAALLDQAFYYIHTLAP